jgi:kynurenine formamidase
VEGKKPGVWKLGIDTFATAAIQGRGVMIDIEAHFGRGARDIRFAEIESILKQDGITVEKGDLVCFRTGFAQALVDMAGNPDRKALRNFAELDGDDPKLLEWITGSGLSALILDNYSLEKVRKSGPPGAGPLCCAMMPIHELCLFKLGIPLGEMWYLSELADWLRANKRSRFMLTAPGLRLPGAAGSPLTPVATV